MGILLIPWRNLRRKPLRTALMILVFAAGVAAVSALATLSTQVGDNLEAKMSAYGANILVTPKRESLHVSYGGMQLGDVSYDVGALNAEATVAAIRSIHHRDRLAAVAPKLALLAQVDGQSVGVIGVDFDQELRIKSYWWPEGEMPKEPFHVLAGAHAARALGLSPGSEVVLMDRPFVVAGVLNVTGGDDDNVIFADITALQDATGKPGAAHFVEIAALCAGCPIEDITDQLEAALPNAEVITMQQVVRERMMTVDFVQRLAAGISAVILLTACVMIGLSIFTSVNERIHEIGLLRALGFSKGSVFAVFSLEAVGMGLVAGVLGQIGGMFASERLAGLVGLGDAAIATFDPLHFVLALVVVPLLAALAALPPALKAARVEPSQALVML
ncbi:MacB-like periplasmic core domain containing protein [Alkalidesulfovibrio alkalitolerans DSM 16529]|uniref:MacB-like periplasmic core domain containing protein n=1 Tax=Alkalidesulfovibrio alkalitolerans DSM 16529 TaxID=1121439 RepID=S7TFT2_9BACT|nr:ABC transporter permease [Alkalidesulfovibrio alkalitolerans]EPR35465.1 MacB-like periplasmic core domain containing protein [Alkalidesulfovibrio alkalitolerans DSM 16529]